MTHAIADAIVEARREAPVREEAEEAESYTYSSDRGAEPEGEGDRKRKRRPRRRRAKPEAIAARLKTGGEVEQSEGDAGSSGERQRSERVGANAEHGRLTSTACGQNRRRLNAGGVFISDEISNRRMTKGIERCSQQKM